MKTFKARYVFPVSSAPIHNGTVTLDGSRIAAVGAHCEGDVHDLGNVAIVPGLINAHAHLDFSDLRQPLGEPGIAFPAWLRLVMAFRRSVAGVERHPVALGLQESVRCGTTRLGDIAQPGWPIEEVATAPLSTTVFLELIGPTSERAAAGLKLAQEHCRPPRDASGWQPGLSPHAPYSVHPELLTALASLSAERGVPIAMHLAETPDELQLMRYGEGPLREFLEELGVWNPAAIRLGTQPLDYLHTLSSAHRALVVHGGCLNEEEIAFLAQHSEQMAIVYCPRTHAWFRREHYPLEKMHSEGVTVALGTDGRGSSPDLSLLSEMRCVAQEHPSIGLNRILQMGTLDGARALGHEREIGSIETDKQADLTVVALPNRDASDPHEQLFHSTEPVVACFRRGRPAYITNTLTIA